MTAWRSILIMVVVIGTAMAGFYVRLASNDAAATKKKAVTQLLQLALPDPEGNLQHLSHWQGKVLVLNFWATWCAPCQEEIPGLIKNQKRFSPNGVQIVGIGLDSASKIRQFSKDLGINYPVLVGDINLIALTRELGNPNSGLPFTVVLDRSGELVVAHLGILLEEDLKKYLSDAKT